MGCVNAKNRGAQGAATTAAGAGASGDGANAADNGANAAGAGANAANAQGGASGGGGSAPSGGGASSPQNRAPPRSQQQDVGSFCTKIIAAGRRKFLHSCHQDHSSGT